MRNIHTPTVLTIAC